MNAIQLAAHARDAALSDYTLRTIRMLAARPVDARLPSDWASHWDGRLPDAWTIQMLGQVRCAARNANAFLDGVDR